MLSSQICRKFLFWYGAKIQNVQHSPTSTGNIFRCDIYFDRLFDITVIPEGLAFKRFIYFRGFLRFCKVMANSVKFSLVEQATFFTFSPITQQRLGRFAQNLNTSQHRWHVIAVTNFSHLAQTAAARPWSPKAMSNAKQAKCQISVQQQYFQPRACSGCLS